MKIRMQFDWRDATAQGQKRSSNSKAKAQLWIISPLRSNFRLPIADFRFYRARIAKREAHRESLESQRRSRPIDNARRHRSARNQLGSESRGTPIRSASLQKQGEQRTRSMRSRGRKETREIWSSSGDRSKLLPISPMVARGR